MQLGDPVGSVLDVPLIPTGVPGLSGLNFDPLSLKNVVDFSKGWGIFNLGTEVTTGVTFTLQNQDK